MGSKADGVGGAGGVRRAVRAGRVGRAGRAGDAGFADDLSCDWDALADALDGGVEYEFLGDGLVGGD